MQADKCNILEFVPLQDLPQSQWLEYVDKSNECWLFHKPEMQDINDPNFHGFAITYENRLMGLCILYKQRVLGINVLTYKRGEAGLALEPSLRAPNYYESICQHLVHLAKKNRCAAIFLTLPIISPQCADYDYKNSHLNRLNFKKGMPWGNSPRLIDTITSLVDLSQPLADIYHAFSKSSKQKCKISEKLNLRVKYIKKLTDETDWHDFVTNHKATFSRSGAIPFSSVMIDFLRKTLKVGHALLINFYQGNRCIASLYLLTYKKKASYFASGVQPEYYGQGVSAYIQWVAMQYLVEHGYTWYDMGKSFPSLKNSNDKKLYNIGKFKAMFGGIKCPSLAGTFIVTPISYYIGFYLPRIMRETLLRLIRK